MLTLLLTLCSFLFVSAMFCTLAYTAFRLGTIKKHTSGTIRIAGKRYTQHGTWVDYWVIPYCSAWFRACITLALRSVGKSLSYGFNVTWLTRFRYRLSDSYVASTFHPYYYVSLYYREKESYGFHFDFRLMLSRLELTCYASIHSLSFFKGFCMRYQERENDRVRKLSATWEHKAQ